MIKTLSTFVTLILLFCSCKKKVEIKEVEVEKTYSWKESKRFTGTQKVFLSSNCDGKTLYLQQPYYFTALTNQNENSGITVYAAGLPTDLTARMPISPSVSAFGFSDTVLRLINNSVPFVNDGDYINLKAIDPDADYHSKNE